MKALKMICMQRCYPKQCIQGFFSLGPCSEVLLLRASRPFSFIVSLLSHVVALITEKFIEVMDHFSGKKNKYVHISLRPLQEKYEVDLRKTLHW